MTESDRLSAAAAGRLREAAAAALGALGGVGGGVDGCCGCSCGDSEGVVWVTVAARKASSRS